jgi:hypothetical protein
LEVPSITHGSATSDAKTKSCRKNFYYSSAVLVCVCWPGPPAFFLVNFSYFHPPARRKVIVLEIGAGRRRNNLFRLRSHKAMEFRRLVWSFAAAAAGVWRKKAYLTFVTRRLTVWNCEFLGFCKRAHRALCALWPSGAKNCHILFFSAGLNI